MTTCFNVRGQAILSPASVELKNKYSHGLIQIRCRNRCCFAKKLLTGTYCNNLSNKEGLQLKICGLAGFEKVRKPPLCGPYLHRFAKKRGVDTKTASKGPTSLATPGHSGLDYKS
jgi:hypothetical protein